MLHNKLLDSPKLKACACGKLKHKCGLGRIENIVAKRENAGSFSRVVQKMMFRLPDPYNFTATLNLFVHVDCFSFSHPVTVDVRGREVERRPCNHEVPCSSPGSGSQLWDFSLADTFGASTGVVPRKQNRERLV